MTVVIPVEECRIKIQIKIAFAICDGAGFYRILNAVQISVKPQGRTRNVTINSRAGETGLVFGFLGFDNKRPVY